LDQIRHEDENIAKAKRRQISREDGIGGGNGVEVDTEVTLTKVKEPKQQNESNKENRKKRVLVSGC
jgi:hypothetical protein